MTLFWIAAGAMAVILLFAASQRPRPSLFVAATLWSLYAVYEYQVATGVLCDPYCNIRVDLVFFIPILVIATLHARRSYLRPSEAVMVVGLFLSAAGLAVLALALAALGFTAWAGVAGICALAIGLYAIKRFADHRRALM